jgi:hypothetical protein
VKPRDRASASSVEIALFASNWALRSDSRFCILQLHARPLGLRLAPIEFRLVPARINYEQYVILLDQLPGLESHFLNVAGDSRALLPRIQLAPFDP